MERWDGIERTYSEEDVRRLRGSVHVEHTLARLGAERLWQLLQRWRRMPTAPPRSIPTRASIR